MKKWYKWNKPWLTMGDFKKMVVFRVAGDVFLLLMLLVEPFASSRVYLGIVIVGLLGDIPMMRYMYRRVKRDEAQREERERVQRYWAEVRAKRSSASTDAPTH